MDDTMIDRVERLERLAAHQDKTIEELSAVVARQDAEIKAMTKRLDALVERFLVVEEATLPDIPIDKPPHY